MPTGALQLNSECLNCLCPDTAEIEQYFLLVCPKYMDLHKHSLSKNYFKHPSLFHNRL